MSIKELKYGKVKRLEKGDPVLDFKRVVVTHKIDGTNARIIWDSDEQKLFYGSRNRLLSEEQDNYGFCKWCKENHGDVVDVNLFQKHFPDVDVVVFGEYFSDKIQKRIAYPEGYYFGVFDVFVNSVFLDWEDIIDVANKLDFEVTPHFYMGSPTYDKLYQKVENYKDPLAVEDADKEDQLGEGIVVRPPKEFKYKQNRRVMKKVKSEKFEEVNKGANSYSKNKGPSGKKQKKVDKYINKNRVKSVVESMKEKDPNLRVSKRITGKVIKQVIQDIREEAREELDNKALGSYGGGKIAEVFHQMLRDGELD